MRLTQLCLTVLIAGLVLLPKGGSLLVTAATAKTHNNAQGQTADPQSTRDAPPDAPAEVPDREEPAQ